MKKMNNYVAPKAEMIELNVNNDVMQSVPSGQQWTETSPTNF